MLFFKKKCFIVVMVKHFFKKGVQGSRGQRSKIPQAP